MSPGMTFLTIGIVMWCAMTLAWLYQRRVGEADIVDFVWTCGVGFAGLLLACLGNGDPMRRLVLGSFIGIWSIRLASHLLLHRVMQPGEDGRYRELRIKWEANPQLKFFMLFQFQALLVVTLAITFYGASSSTATFPGSWDLIGMGLFVISVVGESIADGQLHKFRQEESNRGKVLRSGLWRFSRHPNYFFEWIHWCSYVALASGSDYWIASLIGPLLILFLIFKVTGIPPTERQSLLSRGEEYRRYQETTSAFFPWFPLKTPTDTSR